MRIHKTDCAYFRIFFDRLSITNNNDREKNLKKVPQQNINCSQNYAPKHLGGDQQDRSLSSSLIYPCICSTFTSEVACWPCTSWDDLMVTLFHEENG